jgi:maltose-binding protein MalE
MNALFMQAGADLNLQNKSFIKLSGSQGMAALSLYTSVKAPAVETYAGFSNETLGMIIDYQSAQTKIATLNPFLNFSVAPLPQMNLSSSVVPARYYGLAVSNKSLSQALAWEFVSYATTNVSAAEDYLIASGRPPALRSLIQAYSGTPTHGVFATQALTARSWSMPASEGVFTVFNTMIQSALSGTANAQSVLIEAENAINNLVR